MKIKLNIRQEITRAISITAGALVFGYLWQVVFKLEPVIWANGVDLLPVFISLTIGFFLWNKATDVVINEIR
jgi:hypothetical protein